MTAMTTSSDLGRTALLARRPKRTKGDIAVAGTSHTLLIIWAIIIAVPFLWTLMSSFKTSREILTSPFTLPSRISFDNYVSAWTKAGIGSYFFNTVIVVASSLIFVMLLGAMLAYVLARYKFHGNRLIYNVLLASMTFPLFLAIVPLFFVLRSFSLLNTLGGLSITYVAFALAFTVFFMHSFFEQLPNDVYEAALIDGAGEWRTFFLVMLPMSTPALASVGILNFVGLWNQFMLPIVFNSKRANWVLTQGMAAFSNATGRAVDYGSMFAAVVMTIIPVLIVYILFQRRLQGSVSQGTFR